MEWYLKVLRQYADFEGRARRQEYWMFVLFNLIIIVVLAFVLGFIEGMVNSDGIIMIPLFIYYIGILLPSIAVAVRRLHDQNKSGWYYLVSLIPFVGGIWLLVLLATEGDAGPNQYGPDPKNPNDELNDIGTSEV